MRLKCAAILAALSVAVMTAAQPPKLVVLIVVDQMRADAVEHFQGDWSAGLKRLVTQGAWFTRAAYPYLSTVTCPGHATIATGAFPSVHGVFQNTWFDRGKGAMVTCTQDASVTAVSYGTEYPGTDSAAALRVSTFADEMRAKRGSHVVSLSLKARSAIMLAGHGGDAVTWLAESLRGWETSTAFSPAPVPQVEQYVSAHHVEADYGKNWSRIVPERRNLGPDAAHGESAPAGWTRTFPHILKGRPGDRGPGDGYYQQWVRSPFADEYLGQMAAALAESMGLGKHETTDVLAVSFSSPDLIGHAFGPNSHEIRDEFAHLDRTIGALLNRLDEVVGKGEYVVALSADHGVTEIPEQLTADGRDGGRIDGAGMVAAIDRAVGAALGPGRYVVKLVGRDIYFAPGVYAKLRADPPTLAAVVKALSDRRGISRVFTAEELVEAGATTSKDPLLRAAALSYVEGRSGDLISAPKAGWILSTGGTTHGSANPDDQRVPILLMGPGIKPGRYNDPVTPADIAPTLADLCGIAMPQAQGSVLRVARN